MSPEQFMVRVNGEPFRCDNPQGFFGRDPCGCNVFHKDEQGRYVCNACEARYVGEPSESNSTATEEKDG